MSGLDNDTQIAEIAEVGRPEVEVDGAKVVAAALKKIMEGDEDSEGDEQPINPKFLENIDLTLPRRYEEEVMAAELLEYLGQTAKAKVAWRAARNSGSQAKAQELYRNLALTRLAAALIQGEFPGARALAEEIAKGNVIVTQKRRRELLEENEE